MPKPSRLDVDEDRAFQERFWTFQRYAWAVMSLIVVAALAGLTGRGGPFADAVVRGPAGTIDYPRVTRWQTADQMTITFPASASGVARLELGGAFARAFTIEDMEPQPKSSVATAAGHRFEFELGDDPGAKSVVLHLRAARPTAPMQVQARLGDGPHLPLRLIVLP